MKGVGRNPKGNGIFFYFTNKPLKLAIEKGSLLDFLVSSQKTGDLEEMKDAILRYLKHY
jgi:hypothetical protein